jgi:hypothetical protein
MEQAGVDSALSQTEHPSFEVRPQMILLAQLFQIAEYRSPRDRTVGGQRILFALRIVAQPLVPRAVRGVCDRNLPIEQERVGHAPLGCPDALVHLQRVANQVPVCAHEGLQRS